MPASVELQKDKLLKFKNQTACHVAME
jgi:hypothetical protein